MTRLNTFNALKQEQEAIIHSGAGLAWDGLALQMIYSRDGLGRCFYGTEVWLSIVFNLPQNSLNHSALWHGQLLTTSAWKAVHQVTLFYSLGAGWC